MPEVLTNGSWTKVAFGDVVRQVKDKVDPEDSGLDRYVAGEHMDTNDLKIRRWGLIGDGYLGPAFHMRFGPDQVLYGSRRTYLRKIALADFEGITANTTFVLESKNPEVLLPELLPFIMQTESFHEHSIKQSKGSVNPYVNFSDLTWYEFPLPPPEEQRRIAEVLQAAEKHRNSLLNLVRKSAIAADASIENQMRGIDLGSLQRHERVGIYHGDWNLIPLGELLIRAQYGLSENPLEHGRYPILRMMNLAEGKATEDDLKYVDLTEEEFCNYQLKSGDVLFNRTNSYELVGRTGVYNLMGDHVFASYLIRLNTDTDQLSPDYLSAFLNAPIGRRQVMSYATRGVSQTNVNASNLKRVLVPLPPINYQRRVVELLMKIYAARAAAQAQCASLRSVITKIINEELS